MPGWAKGALLSSPPCPHPSECWGGGEAPRAPAPLPAAVGVGQSAAAVSLNECSVVSKVLEGTCWGPHKPVFLLTKQGSLRQDLGSKKYAE